MTQGEDMQEAYEMAVDALGLALTARENEKEPIPEASALDAVDGRSREDIAGGTERDCQAAGG